MTRIFKNSDSTVGEFRNPADIGIEEMNMQLASLAYFSEHEIQVGLRI